MSEDGWGNCRFQRDCGNLAPISVIIHPFVATNDTLSWRLNHGSTTGSAVLVSPCCVRSL